MAAMIQWGEVFNESRNGEEDDGTIFFDAIESLSAIDVEDTSSLASSDEDGSSSSPRPSPPPDYPPKIPAVESESKNQHRDRDIKNESPSSPRERCASPLSPQLPPPPPPQLGATYLGHSPQSAFEELKHDTDIFRGPIPADNTRSDSDFEMQAPIDPSPDTLSYEYEFCTITPFWSDLCTSIEDEDEEELCVLESGTSHNPPIGVSPVTGENDLVMQDDTFSTPAISCSWLPSPLATSKVATSSSNQEFNLESARSTKGSCDTSVTVSDVRQTDVRVISATNRSMLDMVMENTFREDLYYRINLINIHLPPLRERSSDIPLLVKHFVQSISTLYDADPPFIDDDAYNWLQKQQLPGNIRQLKNIVERTLLLNLGKKSLSWKDFQSSFSFVGNASDGKMSDADMSLEKMEIKLIKKALKHHNALYCHCIDYQFTYNATS